MQLSWYMAHYLKETEDIYFTAVSDASAIVYAKTQAKAQNDELMEVWHCLDIETLYPARLVYPELTYKEQT